MVILIALVVWVLLSAWSTWILADKDNYKGIFITALTWIGIIMIVFRLAWLLLGVILYVL